MKNKQVLLSLILGTILLGTTGCNLLSSNNNTTTEEVTTAEEVKLTKFSISDDDVYVEATTEDIINDKNNKITKTSTIISDYSLVDYPILLVQDNDQSILVAIKDRKSYEHIKKYSSILSYKMHLSLINQDNEIYENFYNNKPEYTDYDKIDDQYNFLIYNLDSIDIFYQKLTLGTELTTYEQIVTQTATYTGEYLDDEVTTEIQEESKTIENSSEDVSNNTDEIIDDENSTEPITTEITIPE